MEIHFILREILPCFFRGRAKDLSAPLYPFDVPEGHIVLCWSAGG